MKFKRLITTEYCAAKRNGFTLVEVLAALVFMAIVIPVAIEALRVASLVGQVGHRKLVATRIAERLLNEVAVTGQTQITSQKGVTSEGQQQFEWTLRSEPWNEDAMLLVSVDVVFPVQGKDYDVTLNTLIDNTTSINSTNTTTTTTTTTSSR
jgi:prepilin-type N-terminal cleavage/methylation domain-containing protein